MAPPWANGAEARTFGLTPPDIVLLTNLHRQVINLRGEALVQGCRFHGPALKDARKVLHRLILQHWDKKWHIQRDCREVMADMDLTIAALVLEEGGVSDLTCD